MTERYMQMKNIDNENTGPRIRLETPEDYNAIERLTYEAFVTLDFPGRRRMDEHYLIWLLQGSRFIIPELCFVAERDGNGNREQNQDGDGDKEKSGEIVGHILYTRSVILRPDGSEADTITFGPLSVLPKYHRQGIGTALVRHSLKKAREMGFGGVLITGIPAYYPKLGFRRAREYELTLEDGTAADSFMAYELVPGYLGGGGVLHFLPPEFERAENDDEGYEKFHARFLERYEDGRK
jgi:predicted N-acetyltransferase YhbS